MDTAQGELSPHSHGKREQFHIGLIFFTFKFLLRLSGTAQRDQWDHRDKILFLNIIWNIHFTDCRVLVPGLGLVQIIFPKIFLNQLFETLQTGGTQRALYSIHWLLPSEGLLDLIPGNWAQECSESMQRVLLCHLIEPHQHFLLAVQLIASCVQAVWFAEEKPQLCG